MTRKSTLLLVSLCATAALACLPGCSTAPLSTPPAIAETVESQEPSHPDNREETHPASAREPEIITLTKAHLEHLFQGKMPVTQATDLAGLLDGACVILAEPTAAGKGRGELVHRQKRTFYVNPITPSDGGVDVSAFSVGLSEFEASGNRAERLFGPPREVCTAEQLRQYLEADPARLSSLSVGERALSSLPLGTLIGIYRVEKTPKGLRCLATPTGRGDVVRFDVTVEYLKLPIEFRYERESDQEPTITAIEQVDGQDWLVYLRKQFSQ